MQRLQRFQAARTVAPVQPGRSQADPIRLALDLTTDPKSRCHIGKQDIPPGIMHLAPQQGRDLRRRLGVLLRLLQSPGAGP